MKITVVGSGAMGCLFGGYLARSGQDVVLLDTWEEHVHVLNRRGLRLWEGDSSSDIRVRAALPAEAVRRADLVLVLVKAYRTADAAVAVPGLLAEQGLVLTLQNGLGSGDILAGTVGADRVLVGVTSQGATMLGPAEVRHGGTGETLLGPYRAPDPSAAPLAGFFSAAGFPARAVDDIRPAVWRKLVVNCGINAVTALTGLRNGGIPEIPEASALLRNAVQEAVAVARAAGIELGDPDVVGEDVLAVARATARNRSSMGQDVDRRNPTEIDFINGAIVREAKRLGVEVPVNETLTGLIKILEESFRG